MIIKREKQIQGGRLADTEKYLRDGKHAALGEACGPKVAFVGTMGGLSDDWKSTVAEMDSLEKEWRRMRGAGTGKPFSHWSISLAPGEGPWTPETAREAVGIFLKHQGMQEHHAVYAVHKDKAHSHIHIYVCQIAPEPDDKGIYGIAWKGSSHESEKGSNRVESAQKCEAEICAKQGWARVKRARWDMDGNGDFIRRAPSPKDPDAVSLGVKIKGHEIRTGEKHPKTILAETSRDIIAAVRGKSEEDKIKAVVALAAAGISYRDVDYLDAKGRRHQGGLLTSIDVPKGVKISSLPRDCRWISSFSKEKAKEYTPTNAPIMIDSQSKVNAEKNKINGKGDNNAMQTPSNIHQTSMQDAAKAIFAERKTEAETRKMLADKGIVFSRETGVDKKTGKSFEYGKLSKEGEKPISLRALGLNDKGKPLYSLASLDYQFRKAERVVSQTALRSEAMPIIQAQAKTGWDASVAALATKGIRLSEEPAVIRGKDGAETSIIYARLEKDGVAVSMKSLVGADGKPLFAARELQRRQLATDAASVLDRCGSWREAEPAIKASGINCERVKTTIIDKSGEEKTVTLIRLERAGVTTSTGMAGKDYGVSALDSRYMPEAQARDLYFEARTQRNAVQYLSSKGYTISDIDRIGRIGEKIEKTQPRPAARGAGPAQAPSGSAIPRNIKEILEQIGEAAEAAARLAQASARANAAEHRQQKAEKALADLKNSIRIEDKKPAKSGGKKPEPVSVTTKINNETKDLDMFNFFKPKAQQAPTPTPAPAPAPMDPSKIIDVEVFRYGGEYRQDEFIPLWSCGKKPEDWSDAERMQHSEFVLRMEKVRENLRGEDDPDWSPEDQIILGNERMILHEMAIRPGAQCAEDPEALAIRQAAREEDEREARREAARERAEASYALSSPPTSTAIDNGPAAAAAPSTGPELR